MRSRDLFDKHRRSSLEHPKLLVFGLPDRLFYTHVFVDCPVSKLVHEGQIVALRIAVAEGRTNGASLC